MADETMDAFAPPAESSQSAPHVQLYRPFSLFLCTMLFTGLLSGPMAGLNAWRVGRPVHALIVTSAAWATALSAYCCGGGWFSLSLLASVPIGIALALDTLWIWPRAAKVEGASLKMPLLVGVPLFALLVVGPALPWIITGDDAVRPSIMGGPVRPAP